MKRDVIQVRPLGGYRVYLRFKDGASGELDLSTMIRFDGVFAPVKDKDYFAKVSVNSDIGTICWPNGADLDPHVLYSAVTGKPVLMSGRKGVAEMGIEFSSVKDIKRLYKGLGDESRLKILFLLNELGEACVGEIQQVLKLAQPTVSRHLGVLRRMGLVDKHRRGRWNYYYLTGKQPDIVKNQLQCLTDLESCRKDFRAEMGTRMDKLLPGPAKKTGRGKKTRVPVAARTRVRE